MLTGPKRREVFEALLAAFPSPPAVEQLLQGLDQSFIQMSAPGSDFRGNLLHVVTEADAGGWLRQLVDAAHADLPSDPRLSQLLSDLGPVEIRLDLDHFEVCRLAGDYVMVDRAPLRASLRSISREKGKRILVVNGGKKSGKSHTLQLISYLHQALGKFSVIPIDLEARRRLLGPTESISPFDIARPLVKRLRYELQVAEPPSDEQWSRWVLDFCDDFETYALDDPHTRWLVIDSFDSVVVMQPALDLVKELAIRISRNLPRFRLVLLGYGESLPPAVHPMVDAEKLEQIGPRELIDFFGLASEQDGCDVGEDEPAEMAYRVLAGLDPADEEFLILLAARVVDELCRLAHGVGTSPRTDE